MPDRVKPVALPENSQIGQRNKIYVHMNMITRVVIVVIVKLSVTGYEKHNKLEISIFLEVV